jgi:hypothetical protein
MRVRTDLGSVRSGYVIPGWPQPDMFEGTGRVSIN